MVDISNSHACALPLQARCYGAGDGDLDVLGVCNDWCGCHGASGRCVSSSRVRGLSSLGHTTSRCRSLFMLTGGR